jgi:hypothetical protein
MILGALLALVSLATGMLYCRGISIAAKTRHGKYGANSNQLWNTHNNSQGYKKNYVVNSKPYMLDEVSNTNAPVVKPAAPAPLNF